MICTIPNLESLRHQFNGTKQKENTINKCNWPKRWVTGLNTWVGFGKWGVVLGAEVWECRECWWGNFSPYPPSPSLLSVCCHVAQLRPGPLLWSHVSLWLHSEYVAGWSSLSVQACMSRITIEKFYARMPNSSREDRNAPENRLFVSIVHCITQWDWFGTIKL